MAQIAKVRLQNGNVVQPGDWTTAEPLYSTVEYPQGPFEPLTAYSYGIDGTSVPGSIGPRVATMRDTNLQGEGNMLPENEELISFNLAVELFTIGPGGSGAGPIPDSDPPEVSLLNLLACQRDMLISYRIGSVNKLYITGPLSYFPAATGTAASWSGARSENSDGALGYISANNGTHNADGMREFATPIRVRGGEAFGVDHTPGPGRIIGLNVNTDDVEGRIRAITYIDGYRRRPVA